MRVDLGALVPVFGPTTVRGGGLGLAVCPALCLLVTSCKERDCLEVFKLAKDAFTGAAYQGAVGALTQLCTLSSTSSEPGGGMWFKFRDGDGTGFLAFTDADSPCPHLLLATDAGQDAVHVIDVVGRAHVGFVAPPGTIAGPRGVAARGSLVAVSAWKEYSSGDHVVHVFEGSRASWTAVRVVAGGFGGPGSADGQLHGPFGLRFVGIGSELGLVVADVGSGNVSMFRVQHGSFVRHLATDLCVPHDVEECEGGWLVACAGSDTVEFVGGGAPVASRNQLGQRGTGVTVPVQFRFPSALALVPGLGLVVRESIGGRIHCFVDPDAIAMSAMSACRVSWMVAVMRGVHHRLVTHATV